MQRECQYGYLHSPSIVALLGPLFLRGWQLVRFGLSPLAPNRASNFSFQSSVAGRFPVCHMA